MFIQNDYDLGIYLSVVYEFATKKGCKFNLDKIKNLNKNIRDGFYDHFYATPSVKTRKERRLNKYFDDNYLFSDATSLYFKGINIFPYLFPKDHRKYIPVENHKEIVRQCNKTLNKTNKTV